MKTLVAGFLLLAATLARAEAIGYEGARHLLNRAGFGATDSEINALAGLSRVDAADRLLDEARREATLAPPAFVDEPFTPYYRVRQMSAEERMAATRVIFQQGLELRAWWLREMLATPSPLTERMTLFWHGHFATGLQKVRSNPLMYRQNVLLRREALGNFGTLLHDIARDPAMLVYLDNAGSRREAPNENFAREVMELFTLGEGRYGERDVKEAARAFTGWSLDRDSGEYMYRRAWHDAGEKTVLGKTGRFDGTQVLDILLERPDTARLVVGKLWREFVSPTPDAAIVAVWAGEFMKSRYEVKPLMKALLTSDAFWAPENRASLIKSPVDMVVGTLRTFAIRPMDMRPAAFACAALGQNPMSPPNVKGWPGGEAWINSATLLRRRQWVERVFRATDPMPPAPLLETPASGPNEMRRSLERGMAGYGFESERWSRTLSPGAAQARIEKLVLAMPPVRSLPADEEDASRLRALVADPAYQLR
ncbi:MAG: DUF1800 domain-containing protein [Usitatibacter sp.]